MAAKQRYNNSLTNSLSKLKSQAPKKHVAKIKKYNKHLSQQLIELTDDEVIELKHKADIESIESDHKVSVSTVTYLTPSPEATSMGYDMLGGDTLNKRGIKGSDIKVAIIDTGIDTFHPDLNVAGGVSFIGDSYQDDQGHGSQVAGIIVAKANILGIKGLAPDAQIYALKAFDMTGSGSYSDIISAIDWSIDNHINIINMSFGGTDNSLASQDAVQAAWDAGILIVTAVGNNGSNVIQFPAQYPMTIAVGSVNDDLSYSNFSNYGDRVEMVAPGMNIYTTDRNSGYRNVMGTSFATAYVTAAAADVWSAHPDWFWCNN
jgi:subtilisin